MKYVPELEADRCELRRHADPLLAGKPPGGITMTLPVERTPRVNASLRSSAAAAAITPTSRGGADHEQQQESAYA